MSDDNQDAVATIATTAAHPATPGPGFEPRVRLNPGDGHPTMSVQTADGRWVRMHGGRDPVTEADRFVAPAFAGGVPPLIIVIGLGLGYVLDAVERRSGTTRVLAIEPLSDAMSLIASRRDLSDWLTSGRLSVYAGPAYLGAMDAFRLVDGRASSPPILVSSVLKREFPRETARAQAVADAIVSGARANEEARSRFAGPYLLNTLKNLPAIGAEADASALFNQFCDVPAIVVAAGPSLDANLESLRRVVDRALLIAVDTALRPLLAAGISPHLVVAVDPQEVNGRHMMDLPDTSGTGLVAEGSIDTGALSGFRGRTFVFKVSDHQPWRWLRPFGVDRGVLRAWGSVLTTAFDLSCRMGCDPVVFTGADLAYTDGCVHCRNTTHEAEWSQLETDDARIRAQQRDIEELATAAEPDIHGRPAATAPKFVQFRDWLVSRALNEPGRRVVNATGAGILHGGVIVQADLASLGLRDVATGAEALRGHIAGLWRESMATGAAEPTRGLPPALLAAIDDLLRHCPADGAVEPLVSWRAFAGDGIPDATYLSLLFDALPEAAKDVLVCAIRDRLNAHPADAGTRRVWNIIGRQRLPTGGAGAELAPPWRAPAGWPGAGNRADPAAWSGLRATAETVTGEDATKNFQSAWYRHFNARRLEHLASLGLDFRAKTVLEVGAGEGDLTTFFTDRECAVLTTDVRDEHLQTLRDRYRRHPFVSVGSLCLDPPPAAAPGRFDIVFCYGVLNHVSDPDETLAFLAACCSGLLVLEAAVHNGEGPTILSLPRNAGVPTASVAGVLTRPGRQWLYDRLRAWFPHVYVPGSQPNHYMFPLDWERPVAEGARAVFVASRSALREPGLVEGLPLRQRRH